MIAESDKMMWLGPTPEMLNDPLFEAIWQTIKTWDVNVPEAYSGYCGANGNHVRAIFEAARLSAPDRAAPLPSREQMVRAAQKQINVEFSDKRPHKNGDPLAERIADAILTVASAPAPAAPRVGDDDDLLVTLRIGEPWTAADLLERFHVSRLSAPPAASADEREELARIIFAHDWLASPDMGTLWGKMPPLVKDKALARADRILAAGYRKLAPAQSVGQSAAQGVGEVRAQTIEEIAQWFLSEVRYWGNVKEQDWSQHVVSHLRRLSALPKGQDDEG